MKIPAAYVENPPMSQPGRARRRRLYHSPLRRDWMPWEVDHLIHLVEQGYSYDRIAKKLKRTRVAVVLKCRRLHLRITKTPATLSAHDAARALGARSGNTVVGWIARGWLPARNAGGAGHKALWRIQWEDLTAFMERRDYWMAWSPDRIPDLALREWAQELRAGQPRWLTPGEVARRYHVHTFTPHQWVTKGLLPAMRYGNLWFWEADLIGFVPPCEVPRIGRHRRKGSLRTTIPPLLQHGAQTAAQIAAALQARPHSVQQALRWLAQRGQVRRVGGDPGPWRVTSFGRIRREARPVRGSPWELA